MIYLAQPFSFPDPAVEHWRYVEGCKAAAWLIKRGEVVYAPICHSFGIHKHGGLEGHWEVWAALDKHFITQAQQFFILTLLGWEQSRGIKAELELWGNHPVTLMHPQPDGNYTEANWRDRP